MKNNEMTYNERYALGYMKGFRKGKITGIRECLISSLRKIGAEQSHTSSTTLIQRINRETDDRVLLKALLFLIEDKLTVEELETCYDLVFLSKEEILHDARKQINGDQ